MLTGPPPKFHGTRDILQKIRGKLASDASVTIAGRRSSRDRVSRLVWSLPSAGLGEQLGAEHGVED